MKITAKDPNDANAVRAAECAEIMLAHYQSAIDAVVGAEVAHEMVRQLGYGLLPSSPDISDMRPRRPRYQPEALTSDV